MNTSIRQELNDISFIIEETAAYVQGYEMGMLMENKFQHLLEVTGYGIDGKSQYIYTINGKETLTSMYETDRIDKTDMIAIIEQLVEAIEEAQNHILDANKIMLDPEYIFYAKGVFYFCYYPLWNEALCVGFHKLTEFFIRELNYENQAGVIMAFELHKGTMTENYDIETIMQDVEVQTAQIQQQVSLPDTKRYTEKLWEDDWIDTEECGCEMVRETNLNEQEKFGIGKLFGRRRKPKWGQWEDLLIEEESTIIQCKDL